MFLGLPLSSNAQNEYLEIPEFVFDKITINDIIDSLKNRKELIDYLIYQRPGTENTVVTYLACKNINSEHLWIISHDSILNNRELNMRTIFSYKNINKTGAIKKEDKLKFKPPMLSVINNEVVIYCNTKKQIVFYFEYGENITTYSPSSENNAYRKKWLEIMRKVLL